LVAMFRILFERDREIDHDDRRHKTPDPETLESASRSSGTRTGDIDFLSRWRSIAERVSRSEKTRRITANPIPRLFEYSRFPNARAGEINGAGAGGGAGRRAISYFPFDELAPSSASPLRLPLVAEHDVFICESPSFERCAPPKWDLSSSRCFVSSREPLLRIRFSRERKYAASASPCSTRCVRSTRVQADRLSPDIEDSFAIQSRA